MWRAGKGGARASLRSSNLKLLTPPSGAAFIVVSRLGVRTSLTPWDVAAIRFGTAGVLPLPYLVKKGLALERLGWIGLAAISFGCGAPMYGV
jgi:hypothetical protein